MHCYSDPGSIEDCLFPIDVGYIETDEQPTERLLLRVQCTEYIMKLYTACGTQTVVATYDSRVNGTIYQCTKMDDLRANLTFRDGFVNFTTSGSIQEFGDIAQSHVFPYTENISYGFCNVGKDVNFVFALRNGSVFSLSFTTGLISTLTHNSCNSSTDTYARGHCYKARMTRTPDIVVAYDYTDSSFKVANLSCPENPMVSTIHLSPRPPLTGFVQLSGGQSCGCRNCTSRNMSTLPNPSSVSPKLTVTPSSSREQLSSMTLVNSSMVMDSQTRMSSGLTEPHLVLLGLFVGFLAILLLVVLIIAVIVLIRSGYCGALMCMSPACVQKFMSSSYILKD